MEGLTSAATNALGLGAQVTLKEVSTSKIALFIKHKSMPDKRDEVRRIWEKHMQPRIAQNKDHEAYFYCYNDNDLESICVYQQYSSRESSQAFLKHSSYANYLKEVEPFLAGEPEVTTATLIWEKRT